MICLTYLKKYSYGKISEKNSDVLTFFRSNRVLNGKDSGSEKLTKEKALRLCSFMYGNCFLSSGRVQDSCRV